jgi:hypothetical protein
MTRDKLGSFWTDTSTILIGDPCQFVPLEGKEPKFRYRQLGDLWDFMTRANYSARETPDKEGVMVDVECDGYYPVYLVRDAKGNPVKLEIILGGQTEP